MRSAVGHTDSKPSFESLEIRGETSTVVDTGTIYNGKLRSRSRAVETTVRCNNRRGRNLGRQVGKGWPRT